MTLLYMVVIIGYHYWLFSTCSWLNSSKTLFEQEVNEGDLLYLRFRYYPFMDIDPRVRHILLPGQPMRNVFSVYIVSKAMVDCYFFDN